MAKTYEVNWTTVAEEDLFGIIDFIYSENPEAAKKVYIKIKSKSETLKNNPEKGRFVPELKLHNIRTYRELIVSPWRLLYKIESNSVFVLAIFDSRRNLEDIILNRLLRKH